MSAGTEGGRERKVVRCKARAQRGAERVRCQLHNTHSGVHLGNLGGLLLTWPLAPQEAPHA